MRACPSCRQQLEITRLRCPACRLSLGGQFFQPRLARLGTEHQRLAEQLILASGNLKQLATRQDVSYPTLRKRLDGLIEALETLQQEDAIRADNLLERVERGEIAPEEAVRMIEELNGGG